MSCDKKMSFEDCELAILRSAVDKIGLKSGAKKLIIQKYKILLKL